MKKFTYLTIAIATGLATQSAHAVGLNALKVITKGTKAGSTAAEGAKTGRAASLGSKLEAKGVGAASKIAAPAAQSAGATTIDAATAELIALQKKNNQLLRRANGGARVDASCTNADLVAKANKSVHTATEISAELRKSLERLLANATFEQRQLTDDILRLLKDELKLSKDVVNNNMLVNLIKQSIEFRSVNNLASINPKALADVINTWDGRALSGLADVMSDFNSRASKFDSLGRNGLVELSAAEKAHQKQADLAFLVLRDKGADPTDAATGARCFVRTLLPGAAKALASVAR